MTIDEAEYQSDLVEDAMFALAQVLSFCSLTPGETIALEDAQDMLESLDMALLDEIDNGVA